eukprot:Sspe_Gene.58641::Locus_32172_Transcript_1_1_Confidence_1.000_Length_2348::g.58641::m.58641
MGAETEGVYVTVWENQRWFPFSGWGNKLLPTDRPAWCNEANEEANPSTIPVPSVGGEPAERCRWASEWEVVTGDNTDVAGWAYSKDFPDWTSWRSSPNASSCVRRRQWRRLARVKTVADERATVRQSMRKAHKQGEPSLARTEGGIVIAMAKVFENQRWNLGSGWSDKLLETDHTACWTTEDGQPSTVKDCILVPAVPGHTAEECEWVGPWTWKITAATDRHGWMYAESFDKFTGPDSGSRKPGSSAYVRRRLWQRVSQVATKSDLEEPKPSLKGSGSMHDWGPGLAACAVCGAKPILNRGCKTCDKRICEKCFADHSHQEPVLEKPVEARPPSPTGIEELQPKPRRDGKTILASEAELEGGASLEEEKWTTGTQMVITDIMEDAAATFPYYCPREGEVQVAVHYACGGMGRSMGILVNDLSKNAQFPDFENTGGWDRPGVLNLKLNLVQGPNRITFIAGENRARCCPSILKIVVMPPPEVIQTPPQIPIRSAVELPHAQPRSRSPSRSVRTLPRQETDDEPKEPEERYTGSVLDSWLGKADRILQHTAIASGKPLPKHVDRPPSSGVLTLTIKRAQGIKISSRNLQPVENVVAPPKSPRGDTAVAKAAAVTRNLKEGAHWIRDRTLHPMGAAPYVRGWVEDVRGEVSFETNKARGMESPTWNETFTINIDNDTVPINLELWNSDIVWSHEFLGETTLVLHRQQGGAVQTFDDSGAVVHESVSEKHLRLYPRLDDQDPTASQVAKPSEKLGDIIVGWEFEIKNAV